VQYAVLTDDFYLFLGIKYSLFTCQCEHFQLSGGNITIQPEDELTLFVDSRIFFSKVWSNFNEIMSCYPQADVLWLTHRSSCRFLFGDMGFHPETDRLEPHSFQHTVRNYLKQKEKRKPSVGIVDFTPFDLKLLSCVMNGMSLEDVSVHLNRPVKQIYAFRSKLSLKLGLRHASYISFHLDRISPYIFYLNLLSYKERLMRISEKK
jgi:hypothetical protein